VRALVIAGLVAFALPARAEAPAEVTADQAVALYRERNPRLVASRSAIDVAAADRVEARIYPNPTAGVSVGSTAHDVNSTSKWSETLDLEIPLLIGKRKPRIHAADAHVTEKRAEVVAGQAEGELEIRAQFIALQAAQQRTQTLAAALDDVRAVRTIVAGRASAGAKSPYDLERIELAVAAMASRVDDAHTDEAAASDLLASLVGAPGWHPRAAGELAAGGELAPSGLDPAHPALAALRAEYASARADEQRAHAEAKPIPSLGLQGFTTQEPSGYAIAAGISVPLPLFDRNQGAIARSRADARRAELELAARTSELDAALARATKELASRRASLARFQAEALERLPRLRAMAESSYRSGQGGIVELVDAIDAITEARVRSIDLVAAVVGAKLAVRTAALGR
jgi:cobalt-zinc-cadmium efflux system outer membrane protein